MKYKIIVARVKNVEMGLGGPYNSEYGLHLDVSAKLSIDSDDFWNSKIFVGTRLFSGKEPTLEEAISLVTNSIDIVKMLEIARVQYVRELEHKPIRCMVSEDGILLSWEMLDTIG